MQQMQRLSGTTQLLYSELLSECLREPLFRGKGISFVKKNINEKIYWYMQIVIGSTKKQHYLGVDSKELQNLIKNQKEKWRSSLPDIEQRERLVAMLLQGGATGVTTSEARVFELLGEAGVFSSGCLLIGSHAFNTYANILGVKWESAAIRTQDIDVLSDVSLLADSSKKNIDTIFEESELELLGIPALNRKAPTTSFKISGRDLKIDLLTPLFGKPDSDPVYIDAIKSYAEPVRFLDYLQSDPVSGVILAKSGVLVNLPEPARFALHKLVVSQRRHTTFILKSRKDIRQAELLLEIILEEKPGNLRIAWDAVEDMPVKFKQQLLKGITKTDSKIRKQLSEFLKLDL